MRIAVVLHDPGPGGSERVALALAAAWAQLGADCRLFMGASLGHPLPQGVPVTVLEPAIRRSPLSRIAVARALVPPLSDFRPQILFLPGNWHFLMARWLAAVRPRPVIVGKLSNPPVPGRLRRLGADALFRAITAPIDAIAAWPEEAARHLEQLAAARPVVRVPNPPLVRPVCLRDPARLPSGRVLVAGRLVAQKDVGLALAAFRLAHAQRPGLSLEIAGDGPERRAIEAAAAGLPVVFHGHLADISALLARADALLLTSRYEGTPAIVLEALAAGAPVVATDCAPFVRKMLDGPGRGTVVSGRSPGTLAAALLAATEQALPMPGIEDALAPYRAQAIASCYLSLFEELVPA